jgi:hypothetical protein
LILFATDLDQTLVGNNVAMSDFFSMIQPLRVANKLKLVYATGRSYKSYLDLKKEQSLIAPDALVCSVGTEIYYNDNLYDKDWVSTYKRPDWDKDLIIKLCTSLGLTFQEPQAQSEYKISFYGNKTSQSILTELNKQLQFKVPTADILTSHAGQYIDITPKNSDKGTAIKYLAKKLNINDSSIIVAGDSLNDVSMFKIAKSIIVGNAYKEVNDWFAKNDNLDVYFAKKYHAGGMLEGLEHYLSKNL